MLNSDKIDLKKIDVLLVDDNPHALRLLSQIVFGFGATNTVLAGGVDEAKDVLGKRRIDLILSAAEMQDQDGYDLLRWLRRDGAEPNKFTPAILVTGHTRMSRVHRARDCGAHFVVSKPIQADVLLERIFWVAKDERMFIDCDAYTGPDRRFKFEGPPPGVEGRRSTDLATDIGEASDQNLSQLELDAMLKVRKIVI
jgi:CheY-like chemotaxis protein